MIASALVVLALADYVYAVLYSYYKPPLTSGGGQWLRTPDWCTISVELENEGHTPLVLTGMEPMPESYDLVATLTGSMAFSSPYIRPEEEIAVQPVAGAGDHHHSLPLPGLAARAAPGGTVPRRDLCATHARRMTRRPRAATLRSTGPRHAISLRTASSTRRSPPPPAAPWEQSGAPPS